MPTRLGGRNCVCRGVHPANTLGEPHPIPQPCSSSTRPGFSVGGPASHRRFNILKAGWPIPIGLVRSNNAAQSNGKTVPITMKPRLLDSSARTLPLLQRSSHLVALSQVVDPSPGPSQGGTAPPPGAGCVAGYHWSIRRPLGRHLPNRPPGREPSRNRGSNHPAPSQVVCGGRSGGTTGCRLIAPWQHPKPLPALATRSEWCFRTTVLLGG